MERAEAVALAYLIAFPTVVAWLVVGPRWAGIVLLLSILLQWIVEVTIRA